MRTVAGGDEFWTPLGVRLRSGYRRPGRLNWLFFPDGPGIGSESLVELVEVATLPGTSWLVDLPGDGSNADPPGGPPDPYRLWPHVLLEAVDAVPEPVAVGHGTGGEFLLSVPSLEQRVAGLALISSAPDAGWRCAFEAISGAADPPPGYGEAAHRYECDPTAENLRTLAVASAPWHFGPGSLDVGRNLLSRMPYNPAAVEWSAEFFDTSYISAWFPKGLPTLIISGRDDRVVDQRLWDDPYYGDPHVQRLVLDGSGHWPWLDRPAAVAAALAELAERLTA